MKTTVRSVLAAVLAAFLICFGAFPAAAVPEDNVTLTAENDPRAGETLTLIVSFTGNNRLGLTASFSYDKALLTLESVRPLISAPWVAENSSTALLFYDSGQESPISGKTDLCALIFRVMETAETGSELTVRLHNIQTSDGSKDVSLPETVYTAKVLPQRSGDATLSSLSAEGFALTPEFSPSVRTYSLTAEVPYQSRELIVHAVPTDANAKVSIAGAALKTGNNNIKITVTAENGVQRVYTVSAVLQKDPDYRESDDGRLSGITLSEGRLTPAFSPDVYKYALYLPFETESAVLTGTALDSRATANSVTVRLTGAGTTRAVLSCQAENGELTQYEIMIIVMPEYTGKPPYISDKDPEETKPFETNLPETDPPEPYTGGDTAKTTEQPTEFADSGTGTETEKREKTEGAPWGLFVSALLLAFAGGGFGGWQLPGIIKHFKHKNHS